jgi:translocation and assembly module TamA
VVLAAALTLAWPVGALDGVRFRVAQSDPGVEAALRAASLVLEAEREGRVSAQDIFAAAQADYQRLLAALYASGRYGGAISIRIDGAEAADIAPLDAPRRIGTVEVGVDPGPLFTFGAAQIEPLAPGTELPEAFAPGLPARSPVVSDAARAAIEGWRAAGHPKAAIVDQGLLARHGARELDVRAGIDPGPRAVLGHLRIVGETQVRPERLAAIAGFEAGAAFSPEALERVVERLRRTGTFRAVSIAEAPTINTDGSLDAEVTVLDNAPRRIGFGAETSSSEGVGVSAYWLHRNLAGGAERLRLPAERALRAAGDPVARHEPRARPDARTDRGRTGPHEIGRDRCALHPPALAGPDAARRGRDRHRRVDRQRPRSWNAQHLQVGRAALGCDPRPA